jgi:hypothetical protein
VQPIYSSESTNQRYEPTSPADSPGEGWGVSMGSISATNYPAGSAISGAWYFLSGVDNVSDRLIPTAKGSTTYYTEHVSRLKVQQVTPSGATQPCFHVWDTLGSVVSSFNNLPNGAAVVLGDQVYGPYGNQRVQQGTISTSKGFTGQFTDFVAGLDYYNARCYDPVGGVRVSKCDAGGYAGDKSVWVGERKSGDEDGSQRKLSYS